MHVHVSLIDALIVAGMAGLVFTALRLLAIHLTQRSATDDGSPLAEALIFFAGSPA